MLRRPKTALLAALGIYLLFRGLVLYTAFDSVCLPNYELYMGNIGKVMLEGGYGPPLYQYYDNCGGHLATGLFALPLFAAFGESYLVLKLVPVGLGVLSMLLIWAIARRHFGTRAAVLAVLLFAIGPPTLAKYSMLAKGNHFENLFFQLAALWCFYRLQESERRGRWLLLFGLLAGFAIFFYFGSMAMLALLALMHLCIRGWRGAFTDLRFALPGLLLGLAPLAWVNWNSNFRPGGFLDAKLGGEHRHGLGVALERMQQLVTDFLPRGGCFEDLGPLPGRLAEWLWLGAWVLAFAVLLPGVVCAIARCLRRSESLAEGAPAPRPSRFEGLLAAPFVAFLPTFVVLFGVSTFEFKPYGAPVEVGQFRYLVPHFMFSCLLIGIAAARLWQSERAVLRAGGWLLALASLSTSLFSLPLIDWSSPDRGLGRQYDGFEFAYLNNVLQRDAILDEVSGERTWDLERLRAQLLEVPLPERVRGAIGVGNYAAWAQSMPPIKRATQPRAPGLELGRLLAPFPVELQLDLARGAGSFLRGSPHARELAAKRLRTGLLALDQEAHPQLPHLIYGLCEEPGFPLARNTRAELAHDRWLGQFVPESLLWAWWRGQGIVCGQRLARGIESDLRAVDAYLASSGDEQREELWFGLGFGAGEKTSEGQLPPAFEQRLRAETLGAQTQRAALIGFGAGLRHAHDAARRKALFLELRATLDATQAGHLEIGARWPDYPLPLKL